MANSHLNSRSLTPGSVYGDYHGHPEALAIIGDEDAPQVQTQEVGNKSAEVAPELGDIALGGKNLEARYARDTPERRLRREWIGRTIYIGDSQPVDPN